MAPTRFGIDLFFHFFSPPTGTGQTSPQSSRGSSARETRVLQISGNRYGKRQIGISAPQSEADC